MSLPGSVEAPDWLTLDRDERVWVRAHPSKNLLLVSFAVGTAIFLALGIVGILFTVDVDTARTVSLVLLLALFVATGWIFLLTRRQEYVVTSHRVCVAAGLTSREVTTVDATDVREVAVEQSSWQSLINVGDLRLATDGGNTVRFASVENPDWVRERVLEAVEADDVAV